ncbi:MAG TPA: hypothetical protein VG223_00685 [Solirubrobacteraceae bacterium]|jgi:hypothetical protein|nr:hypothetical protein [Solirubrobacteraceae bacterium]
MTLSGCIGVGALALLEGALVALPKDEALHSLARWRSPAWAAALPGSILVGTFGVQALPLLAVALVALAGLAAVVLSAAALLSVAQWPRSAMLPVGLTLAALSAVTGGWSGELSASTLTGLGCLTVGVALVRLIPRHFILSGVISMCLVDVTLLLLGAGQPAAALMSHAARHLPGPVFAHASAGPISTDYPDLVLAGVLGGFVGGHPNQWRTAALLATLVAAYGMLLPYAGTLPATVPIAVTFVICRPRRLHERSRHERGTVLPPSGIT